MKVLNLYAGIGGNRKLWQGVEVTAVEMNPEIAAIYQDFFPDDKVIVGDAHEYLLNHFKEFDFIWSSPPCQSHSKFRFITTFANNPKRKRPVVYPDMSLYQEVILLENYFQGLWAVENVHPYYESMRKPVKCGRHLIWSNFEISNFETDNSNFIRLGYGELKKLYDFDLSKFKIKHRKDQILRNCVNPELGKHIFDCAFNGKSQMLFEIPKIEQVSLFQ